MSRLVRVSTGHYRIDGPLDPRGGKYTCTRYRSRTVTGFRWAVDNSRGSQVEDCETLAEVEKLFASVYISV
jgi:hypothetical protein